MRNKLGGSRVGVWGASSWGFGFVVALAVFVAGLPAGAETFRVNHVNGVDVANNDPGEYSDAVPGDGLAETSLGTGRVSLRSAIQEANLLPGHDTIIVEAGTTLQSRLELPPLTDPEGVTIMAEGEGNFVYDGSAAANRLSGLVGLLSSKFDDLDVNDDMQLTFFETQALAFADYRTILHHIGGVRFSDFQRIDTDGDNRLSMAELDGYIPSESGLIIASGNNIIRNITFVNFPFHGIRLDTPAADNNIIQGCLIGTTGASDNGNKHHGILLSNGAENNLIGGTTEAARNIISGNGTPETGTDDMDNVVPLGFGNGVHLDGPDTTGNRIIGNYIGVNADGSAAVPNAFSGVVITNGASGNFIGGSGAGAGNIISGNGDASNGCPDNCGNGMRPFYGNGVYLDGSMTLDNVIQGNLVGVGAAGEDVNNKTAGIRFDGAIGNLIGGPEPGAGNTISGHGVNEFISGGIALLGCDSTVVENNNVTGNGSGIYIEGGLNCVIGSPGAGNVFSGNTSGVDFGSGFNHVFQGNYVGTNRGGTSAIANFHSGFYVSGFVRDLMIGGSGPGEGNVFSGNRNDGIVISSILVFGNSDDPVIFVQGNQIGTNAAGTEALPNRVLGILLDQGARNVQIGGTGDGEGNVISGNLLDGIRIARSNDFQGGANHIVIQGNLIGTNATATGFIPNSSSGIAILEGGNTNTIGGIVEGEGNIIAGNAANGVHLRGGSLETTAANTIRGNSIYSNGNKGILLQDDANAGILAPAVTGLGPVSGTAPPNTTVDLYGDAAGQGRLYVASTMADGAGNYSLNPDLSVLTSMGLNMLTATATDAGGNTSEFSLPFEFAPPTIVSQPVNVVVVEGDPFNLATVADGTVPLTYLWEYSEDGSTYAPVAADAVVSGVNTPTLANSAARLTDAGFYRCTVTNPVDSVMTVAVTVEVVRADIDTVTVSTLNDTADGDTRSPAHLSIGPGADGFISLREAIIAANNRPGADTISFNGALRGTITPDIGLPDLTDTAGGTTIQGARAITLSGQNLGGQENGLRIRSANNVITGLSVIKFPGNGLDISGVSANGNLITGCVFGNDGTANSGNRNHGIIIQNGASENVIGGATTTERNIISGNTASGIYVTGVNTTGNTILGNYIGLTAAGSAALPNGATGISLTGGASDNTVGGPDAGDGNIVSANGGTGILVSGLGEVTDGNVIAGNTIGLGANGETTLGNLDHGVAVLAGATNTIIGGETAESSNTIGRNGDAGVLVEGPNTAGNTIRFNAITGNFGRGIVLSNAANNGIAAPALAQLTPLSGTAPAGSTVDIFVSDDDEGETLLDTVAADGSGAFSSAIDLEPHIGRNITATATDAMGNTSEFSDTIFVDLEPPVLTLLGESPVAAECGVPYVDAGATAEDDVDGNLTARIDVTITFGGTVVGAVDTSVIGTYTILYEVSDNAGQVAVPVTRIVVVSDTTVPVITLTGNASVVVECRTGFTDPGATAADGCDGEVAVTVSGAVNTSIPGAYPLLYSAVDGQGNEAIQVIRTVTVVDTTAPVITVSGSESIVLECGTPYLDAGATVSDTCDDAVAVVVDNAVEPGVPGMYTVLYDAVDAAGNRAVQRFRTVEVVDTIAPVITLLGANDITVECGMPFVDPGVTITDACDDSLPPLVTGGVNTAIPGNYTLAYSASDSSGNVAATVTRTVRVRDNAVPAIVINGPATVNVACEGVYGELGATATDACEGDLTAEIVITGAVDTTTPGQYTVNYDVRDSEGNAAVRRSRTVVVSACPAPCEDQCAGDPDDLVDADGDGLSACVEACLGTSDTLIDSDLDGVPDNVEVETGTDPTTPDSDLDLDGDGLTQLEEFIFDSDPLDPNDPAISFFVSPGGSDAVSGGGPTSPWGTIAYALSQADAGPNNPVRIVLAEGNYPEDVVLLPWVTLVGAVGSLPRIEGTVFGANDSALVNVELAAFTSDDVMLVLDGVAMSVENVVFRGSVARPAAGILALGAGSGGSMIDGCLFTSLSIGIDVEGALPAIRRCTFEDTTIAAVFVRAGATVGATLGDVNDPSTGSNLFSGVLQGRAIINESGITLLAQQNDWGTADVGAIERTLLTGRVVVAPVLPPGTAGDTGSLYVTVWTAIGQNRIRTASVVATNSSGASAEILEVRNGVYALPVLRSGTYSLVVSAPSYTGQSLSVTVAPGELRSQIVALALSEEKPGGPSCHGLAGAGGGFAWSDALLALFLLGGLWFIPLRGRSGPLVR